jgi:hypothetical protein
MKRFINFLIIMHYWSVVAKSRRIIDDPKSKHSTLLAENLTLEEMDGVVDTERVGRLLEGSPKSLIKDFKHLRKCLEG